MLIVEVSQLNACSNCGNMLSSRNESGYCSKNKECIKLRNAEFLRKHPERVTTRAQQSRRANSKYHKNNPWVRMFHGARHRALRLNLPFTITVDDVRNVWTDRCPVFGVPLGSVTGKIYRWSPSLDRIRPELGYVPGNIQILSVKANSMKQDATPHELKIFAEWVLANG